MGSCSLLVTGSADKSIRVWDMDSGVSACVLRGHTGVRYYFGVHRFALCRAVFFYLFLSFFICLGGFHVFRNSIRVYSTTVYVLVLFKSELQAVVSLCVLSGGFSKGWRIASGSMDCTVRVWNLLAESCERVLEGHSQV
jgi:WD40 repeat protein